MEECSRGQTPRMTSGSIPPAVWGMGGLAFRGPSPSTTLVRLNPHSCELEVAGFLERCREGKSHFTGPGLLRLGETPSNCSRLLPLVGRRVRQAELWEAEGRRETGPLTPKEAARQPGQPSSKGLRLWGLTGGKRRGDGWTPCLWGCAFPVRSPGFMIHSCLRTKFRGSSDFRGSRWSGRLENHHVNRPGFTVRALK